MDTPAPISAQDKASLLFSSLLSSIVRHAMTGAAGFLVTKGFLPSNQADQAAEIFAGILLAIVALAWSFLEKKFKLTKLAVPPQVGMLVLAFLLLSGCAMSPATKQKFAATGNYYEQRIRALAQSTVIDVATSQLDKTAKANLLDSLASAFWSLPVVTSEDVKFLFATWLPEKAHWTELEDLVARQVATTPTTPADIATALNRTAADARN